MQLSNTNMLSLKQLQLSLNYVDIRGVFRGGGALGHGPPLAKKYFFYIEKKIGKLGLPPPLYEH